MSEKNPFASSFHFLTFITDFSDTQWKNKILNAKRIFPLKKILYVNDFAIKF